MTAATATGRPSPASLPSEADPDTTPAAREHRLSGRWADAEVSEFPKFTAWRLTARLTRAGLAAQLDCTEALIRRIEEGQTPSLAFVGRLVAIAGLTRDQAIALFSVNGKPLL